MDFKALVIEKVADKSYQTTLQQRAVDSLPEGDLLIEVHYSSLNYKDALSAAGNPGVTRHFPHTPGIDAVGVVKQSANDEFSEGDEVIVTGYDLGMSTSGGLAEMIRVPAAWVLPLPAGLSARQAMVLGTAGLTAGLSVDKLLTMGAANTDGKVLVTGATGGVGAVAVALLAKLGFDVVASTGKLEQAEGIKALGAKDVIDRAALSAEQAKPALKPEWAHAVDCVGGNTLANVLKQIKHGGSVTCCGLVESANLPTTVIPFILRNVNLLGVDSVEIPLATKQNVWKKFASQWVLDDLESMVTEIALEDVPDYFTKFYSGQIVGRILVKVK